MTPAGPDADAPDLPRNASARWALASLSLAMLLSSLGTSIANVALPTLAENFNASFQQIQWVVLAYLLAITTMIVSVGKLGDLAGRKKLMLAGIALFTLASLLAGAAPTLWLLIAARAVQGLGAAIMMALAMAFVADTMPKAMLGSAMGLLGSMSAVGTAIGPSLGGLLLAGLNWQAIFLVHVPLGVIAFYLAWRNLPADHRKSETKRAGFDKTGTLLLALTLAAYALAMTTGKGGFGLLSIGLVLAALLGTGLFVLVETRVASPLIRLAMFRKAGLSASLAMNVAVSTVMMATLVVGPFYLARTLGLSYGLVGLVMSVGPVASALSGYPAGKLVDRYGVKWLVVAGLVAMAAGAAGLSVIPSSFSIAGYLAAIILLTPGYALFQAANNTAVMMDVQADQRGVISGMLNLSRNLGLITGASVMGAVFAFASGTADIVAARPDAIAAGMHGTFAVAAVLVILALVLAIRSLPSPLRTSREAGPSGESPR